MVVWLAKYVILLHLLGVVLLLLKNFMLSETVLIIFTCLILSFLIGWAPFLVLFASLLSVGFHLSSFLNRSLSRPINFDRILDDLFTWIRGVLLVRLFHVLLPPRITSPPTFKPVIFLSKAWFGRISWPCFGFFNLTDTFGEEKLLLICCNRLIAKYLLK